MSFEYRQRLRERNEETLDLSAFHAQTGHIHGGGRPRQDADEAEAVEDGEPVVATIDDEDDETGEEPAVVTTDVVQREAADVVDVPQLQEEQSAIVPQGEPSMTPAELREHAITLAAQLVSYSPEDYANTMNTLQQSNPSLYAVVCDEIENLNAQQEAQADDERFQS